MNGTKRKYMSLTPHNRKTLAERSFLKKCSDVKVYDGKGVLKEILPIDSFVPTKKFEVHSRSKEKEYQDAVVEMSTPAKKRLINYEGSYFLLGKPKR